MTPARLGFLTTTPGLALLVGEAAVTGSPGAGVMTAACLGWSAFATAGVFFPWLEMFGHAVCRGPSGSSEVALTFDDGPHPETTRKVLEALRTTRHRATFFVLGEKARRHPDVVREIADHGHALGVHGDWHDRLHSFRLPGRVCDEIRSAQAAVETACGVRPHWFRPPLGHTSPTTVRGARRAGVTLVGWSARGYDGLPGQRPETVVERVARDLRGGSIVLLHDAAERDDFEPASVAALPALLDLLDRRGLTSVQLDGWAIEPRYPELKENSSQTVTRPRMT